jgi:Protein of unknown function (DUF2985)
MTIHLLSEVSTEISTPLTSASALMDKGVSKTIGETDAGRIQGQIEDAESKNNLARHEGSRTGGDPSERAHLGNLTCAGKAHDFVSAPYDTLADLVNEDNYNPGEIPPRATHDGEIHGEVNELQNENSVSIANKPSSSGSDITPTTAAVSGKPDLNYRKAPFDNGYHFPPKHTWAESTMIGLKGFWNYATTWLGFLVILYGLNIVAWGGMIFLLLCNAAPAMCSPTCNDINSPRRIWIEYDSQILTALFCVTGFGLIPWRFRDLYHLLKFRLGKDEIGLRRLAGIHRGWFRLEGSQDLPVLLGPKDIERNHDYPARSLPYPLKLIPEPPLTGARAPPTPLWKLDFVIWMFVWNTFLQAVLSGLMWGINRYDRPSWSVGLFVGLACVVAACAGIMIFVEGKKINEVEGVPVSQEDIERLQRDRELGIQHWNNINDKMPKGKRK